MSQRRHIRSQMGDVIRRSGTGLKIDVRWKSGIAPAPARTRGHRGCHDEVVIRQMLSYVRNPLPLRDLTSHLDSY